jgi:hypothetical protein
VLKIKLIILFYLFTATFIRAQDSAGKASPVFRNSILLCANYGRQLPVGILSKRFGSSNSVGFTAGYKFGKNFQFQAGINTFFSGKVRENDLFDSMKGSNAYLLDINGTYAEIRLYERGYHWHVDFGKIIPVNKFDKNSGILITGGLGFMQHKIKFIYQQTVLPQLDNGYYKGYDRLTNGLMARGFIGYQRIDPENMLNFVAGVELLNGFTQNRRELNYDTRVKDNASRNDLLIGLKIGVMVTLSGRQAGQKKGQEEKYFE